MGGNFFFSKKKKGDRVIRTEQFHPRKINKRTTHKGKKYNLPPQIVMSANLSIHQGESLRHTLDNTSTYEACAFWCALQRQAMLGPAKQDGEWFVCSSLSF